VQDELLGCSEKNKLLHDNTIDISGVDRLLDCQQIEQKKIDEMFKELGGIKNARKLIKSKNR